MTHWHQGIWNRFSLRVHQLGLKWRKQPLSIPHGKRAGNNITPTNPFQRTPLFCNSLTFQIQSFYSLKLGLGMRLRTLLVQSFSIWIKQAFVLYILWSDFWSFHLKSNKSTNFNILLPLMIMQLFFQSKLKSFSRASFLFSLLRYLVRAEFISFALTVALLVHKNWLS